ncbi:hypothetical protein T10_5557 [Trichinella papuae]|uniref:Uncharacterized protein n=1 Tax=Trichinella papuae TaxID=268474 RepID=A0A0V1MRM3_9BILA|nr:hypothetical protein T10_5557 [Trichinella papuae]
MPSGRGQQMCRTGCLSLKATPIDCMQLLFIHLNSAINIAADLVVIHIDLSPCRINVLSGTNKQMTFKQQLCSATANCASVQKGREQLRNIYYIKHFSIHTYEDDDNLFSKCQVQVYYSVLLSGNSDQIRSATRMNVEYDL